MLENTITKTINFSEFRDKIFLGYEKGKAFRNAFDLNNVDKNDEKIEFIISDDVYATSSSFIRGMFEESIINLGSQENFFAKYTFTTRYEIKCVITAMVTRTLVAKKLFN